MMQEQEFYLKKNVETFEDVEFNFRRIWQKVAQDWGVMVDDLVTEKLEEREREEQERIDWVRDHERGATVNYHGVLVTYGPHPHSNPRKWDLWVDNSQRPPVWYQWDGARWTKITRTFLGEMGGYITSVQIGESAILAPHIAANTIESYHISTAGLDAGVITSGVIASERLFITGRARFGEGYDPSKKETPDGAQEKVDSSKDDLAQKIGYADYDDMVDKAISDGLTIIDGGYLNTDVIEAGTIFSDFIWAGELQAATGTFKGELTADKVFVGEEGKESTLNIVTSDAPADLNYVTFSAGNYVGQPELKTLTIGQTPDGDKTNLEHLAWIEIMTDSLTLDGDLAVNDDLDCFGDISSYNTLYTGLIRPHSNNLYDLGTSTHKYRDLYLSRDADIAGDLSVGGDVEANAFTSSVGSFARDDDNYIHLSGIGCTIHIENTSAFRVNRLEEDPDHWGLRLGRYGSGEGSGAVLKALGGTIRRLQFRRADDEEYIDIEAEDVRYHGELVSASSRDYKEGISPAGEALALVANTPVYNYKMKGRAQQRVGIVAEESPDIIRRDDSISVSNSIGLLWKAMQELNEKVEGLREAGEQRPQ